MKFYIATAVLALVQAESIFLQKDDSLLGRFLSGDDDDKKKAPTYHLPNGDELDRKERKHIKNASKAAIGVLDLDKNGVITRQEARKVFKQRLAKKANEEIYKNISAEDKRKANELFNKLFDLYDEDGSDTLTMNEL